jgi:hypothetical protein
MSSLQAIEKGKLEKLFEMSHGCVLNFSDSTIASFFSDFDIDIHSEQYTANGTSKANKLRTFWKIEPDALVGNVLISLIDYKGAFCPSSLPEAIELTRQCRAIAERLQARGPSLASLKQTAVTFNAAHLAAQIRRMESSVQSDPPLAIGTAKELIETCCKTILAERGKPIAGTPDIPALTKETLKALKLVPEDISEATRGHEVIKRLLSNLGTIGNGLAELRGLYGTGHGKHGRAVGLKPRHAKLAVGAATVLATFLFETHMETKS